MRAPRLWLGLALLVALGACAPRGVMTAAPEGATLGAVQTLLVATTRAPDDGPGFLSAARSGTLGFARIDVSVPPDRRPGTVRFPRGGVADPATDFLALRAERLPDAEALVAEVDAALAGLPPDQREVVVFVHGFNTNFSEGLFRQAQMRHDFAMPGVSVNYAWPSRANVRAYASDRESALFARDGLEATLRALARSSATRIILVGHSMGAFLAMETTRQIGLGPDPDLGGKFAAVALIAPDIDLDVFRAQKTRVAEADVPTYLFVSGRDRALRLSSRLRGADRRLGTVTEATEFAGLAVTVIDMTDVGAPGDRLGHFKVATSPTMIAFMSGMDDNGVRMFREEARRPNLFEVTVNVVQDVTEVVLGAVVP